MLLTEDYFNGLDIENEDINSNDDNLSSYTASEQFEYFSNHYEDTISLNISKKMNIGVLINNVEILAKRINYLFDLYDVEHSKAILCDNTVGYAYIGNYMDRVRVYERPQFNMFTTDYEFISGNSINPEYNYSDMYIIFYVKYPKFSYKKAYSFVQHLMKIVWNTIDYYFLSNISLLYPVCVPNLKQNGYSNKVAYIYPEHMNNTVNDCIGEELWIDGFFRHIMEYFFGENEKTENLISKLYHGINPFM